MLLVVSTSIRCELFVRKILPKIRAYIACELVKNHGFSQLKVAKVLGIKQPMVNYFVTGKRAANCVVAMRNIPELKRILDEHIEELKRGVSFDPCKICRAITSDETLLRSILAISERS